MKAFLLLIIITLPYCLVAQTFDAPFAEKILFKTYIHKDTLKDDYYWLRDKHSAQTINYLYANNAYAINCMKEDNLLQKILFEEFKSREKENYDTRPEKLKNYYYYNRIQQDKEYPDIFRKKDSLKGKEQMVLDLNKLAVEFSYFNLGVEAISPDHKLLAYGIDIKGNNVCRLYVKNIDADSIYTGDMIDSVLSVLWSSDNKSFYYITPEPKTLRGYRVYRHIIGTAVILDELVFNEPDKTYQLLLERSASKKYIMLTIGKTNSDEVWYWLDSNVVKPEMFLKRQPDLEYNLNHFEGAEFYIYTNYKAQNYQLMKAPIDAKNLSNWKSLIASQKNILLNSYDLLKDYLILNQTVDVAHRVIIINRKTGLADTLDPGLNYSTLIYGIPEYNYDSSTHLRLSVQNFINPASTYDYNLYTHKRIFIAMDTVQGKYSPSMYETKRMYAKANDGANIPITIYYKKGLLQNGKNPALLTAYGSYGSSSLPQFSAGSISYMDRGFVMATAHIRGGKELGKEWYEMGKMMQKKNTFTDFIACAQKLIDDRYTSPQKLAITGGSAGGLLMGAVLNMKPGLFNCAVANVPFVDVINTMLDESIPLTTFEFEEWGNPKIKSEYDYMKSYSPYENVKKQAYPNILVTAGYNDAQVGYWEPAKWVSRLREFKTDTNLLLFKTNMDGGHGGASGKNERLKEQAFDMAFMMKSLGIKENYLIIKGKVTDENNEPLVYASVYREGTTFGTSTNVNGEFELQVKEIDNTVLVFQTMGYVKQKVKLNMGTRTASLHVKLKSENIQLKSVTVNANAKDPAYAIIKEAIKRRKENAARVQSYSSDVYMKSNVRLMEIPKKRPAFIPKSQMPDSNDLGLVYLSESVAKYYTRKPDDYKEEMLASKVAGEKQGFSWNRVRDVFFSLYDASINLEYYSDRPFVSPIAPLATLSYNYKFKGSFFVERKEINKIEIIPKRKGDPLFRGYIYITSDDYQVYGSELLLTKDAQIQLVDTVNLLQETINVNDVWMPIKMQVSSFIKIFGFRAIDISVAAMSNYNLNRTFDKKFFNNETFKIDKSANSKDTIYWGNSRLIKLTNEENGHYYKSDSVYNAEHTKHYLDSTHKLDNEITFGKVLITGYTYSKTNDTLVKFINVSPLLFGIGYNTVEGTFLNYDLRLGKYKPEDRKSTFIDFKIRYGTVNKNFAPGISFYHTINPLHDFSFSIKAGRFIEQYNTSGPVNGIVNGAYTLFDRANFMKILQIDQVTTTIHYELLNGLYTKFNLQYFKREAMVNHTDFSFVKNDKAFTSNNPLTPLVDAPAFVKHGGASFAISLRYLHNQKFESMPGYKNVIGSNNPEIYLSYKTGLGTDALAYHYHYLEAGVGKDFDLHALGEFKFDLTGGTYLYKSNMLFADYKHFNGNQTFFLFNPPNLNSADAKGREQLTGFHALDYYTYSTNMTFIEAHALHNFRGFFISKIPLLRRLKARELLGINSLYTNKVNYNEIYFGLTNIFSFLRIDAGTSNNSATNKVNWFYRVGMSINLD